jgi:thioredoxin-related protein
MKSLSSLPVFLFLSLIFFCCDSNQNENQTFQDIQWMSWEEAIQANRKKPKKIFIDMYTDWCGWCKRMDRSTFADQDVVNYMNKNFYPVKFDAEQKKVIKYKNQEFRFISSGKRGYHELASTLLDGRLSYPSFVFLNEDEQRVLVSPGFKRVDEFVQELRFVAEDHFKSKSLKNYKQENLNG